jgi:hypothetical protein
MLTLQAYFDETGHGDDANTPFLGIVGCLAAAPVWRRLEERWAASLASEGLNYFHMREYAFSVEQFKDWRGDEARRRRIYAKLWEIILRANLIPLGSFVLLENYKQELTGQEQHMFRDAYFLCYLQCLRFLAQYAEFGQVGSVDTFFDEKKGFKGEALKMYGVLTHRFGGKISPPAFCDMRTLAPLQVADIIAYESKKEFERRSRAPEREPRWGFVQLEELISRSALGAAPPFGDVDSPIALFSSEELANISEAQRLGHDE